MRTSLSMKRQLTFFLLTTPIILLAAQARIDNHLPVTMMPNTEVCFYRPVSTITLTNYISDIELSFKTTPTNEVTLCFGVDANGDGELEIDETSMQIGFDYGTWHVRTSVDSIKEKECSTVGDWSYIDLKFEVSEAARILSKAEIELGSGDKIVAEQPEDIALIFKDFKDWNMLKVCARGVEGCDCKMLVEYVDFTPDAATALHLPGEVRMFTNAELKDRFGHTQDSEKDYSVTRKLQFESASATNIYAVKFVRWAINTPEFIRYKGVEQELKGLLGIELSKDCLGDYRTPPQEGFVKEDDDFRYEPKKPYRSFKELFATRNLSMTRIGSLTSTAHFKSALEADAEAVAIAEDLAKRFDLVPEVAVQGKAWLLQTPRILGILTRCQANGDECVSLTLHDKQANSIYVSLSDPEKFAEE